MSAKRRRKAAGPAEPVAPPPTPEAAVRLLQVLGVPSPFPEVAARLFDKSSIHTCTAIAMSFPALIRRP